MAFRVYDTEKERWVKDKVYLSPEGEMFIIKHSIFGWNRIPLALSEDRYILHKAINLHDKNNNMVFEGDYIRAEVDSNKFVTGIVTYAYELSSYVILCFEIDEYYTLGTEVCGYIEVIGNVFDGFEKGKWDGRKAL